MAVKEVGTLRELGVKPGDVVEWEGQKFTVMAGKPYDYYSGVWASLEIPWKEGGKWISEAAENCRIISRASDTPKLWRDMTPEEKGALLLAHYEGKVIECWQFGHHFWLEVIDPNFCEDCAYRVKPEPKVEVVTGVYWREFNEPRISCMAVTGATHIITFKVIDGEPDCASIKMEKINGK